MAKQTQRTIDLKPLVRQWKSGELTIPDLAEKVVEHIEKSGWLTDTIYPDTLRDLLGRLKRAEDQLDYEYTFEFIYDVADRDRVWIECA